MRSPKYRYEVSEHAATTAGFLNVAQGGRFVARDWRGLRAVRVGG